ncbi:nucleotidyltransferase family protein [Sphingomonas sp. SUN039]|uniref:nucleotidyltransferase family protein n=1 Tax=Sphingomonas sp. SUN039 TaxID=2937787 RepID=UPI0021642E9B|nr:nucleotidyltransferase domain-containing protein [Sphingomonas sp. SUN039]UVO54190.1 nucleotidyltransferase domain-containing protein [Sphingomonas sp. SUN039]
MPEIELTGPQRQALLTAIAPFADTFDSVGVFGSRVTGSSRPGSDIDLVFYGVSDEAIISRLREALEESDLSIFADVHRYETIEHPPLKAEIDRWATPLFAREELRRAA